MGRCEHRAYCSISAASAWRIGTALQTDVRRQSVLRWERKVADALQVSSQRFYKSNESRLCQTQSDDYLQYKALSFRMDATNTNMLHHEPVQAAVESKVMDMSCQLLAC